MNFIIDFNKHMEIWFLIALIDDCNRPSCIKLYNDNKELMHTIPGSSHNHQAYPGGYIDHITDCMKLAVKLYDPMYQFRNLHFSLPDALLVLFLHDLEKIWKYGRQTDFPLKSKADRKEFRAGKIQEYGISLTAEQQNAVDYIEGEGDDYSSTQRAMGPLAAFCHMIDVASARIWFDKP